MSPTGLLTACALASLFITPSYARVNPLQEESDRDRFADRAWQLLDVVTTLHIHPPPLRDLLSSGIEQLASDVEPELSDFLDRIPEPEEAGEVQEFLRNLYDAANRHGEQRAIVNAMVRGISARLPGGATTVDAETARVNDSLAANQYEGVGVVLDFKGERPTILDTYFGGPAHRAGILSGDIVYEVYGFDTVGMDVRRFFEYSRDEVGTELEYVVGQPGSSERRTVTLIRGVVPSETVTGTERAEDERWSFELPSSSTAYVKLTGITASTAHELRKMAERIQQEGLREIVLDLRGCRSTLMHDTALVADLFLEEAVVGGSATRAITTRYRTGPEVMFDCSSTAVLVDGRTRGTAEWLAAVLRRGGAVLVGEATAGVPFLPSRVTIPRWPVEVQMATGWVLDPEAEGQAGPNDPLRSIQPDHFVSEPEHAIDAALELRKAKRSPR